VTATEAGAPTGIDDVMARSPLQLGTGDRQVLVTQWRALPDIFDDTDIIALQALWNEALEEMVL
jgi:hypothetical protein